jgi:predicted nicotinamide N-methyase
MPYWAYLWPGAFLLAEAVAREPWPSGQTAIELGCGLGLAGLVALHRGLKVRFTDYDETPLRFAAESAVANGFGPTTFATAMLDWRSPPDDRFPVILAADVLYERRLVTLVANVIARMLEPGGLALLASPYRVAAEGFEDAARALGLRCATSSFQVDCTELGPVRGTIYRIQHR